jgi:hypothetical protein
MAMPVVNDIAQATAGRASFCTLGPEHTRAARWMAGHQAYRTNRLVYAMARMGDTSRQGLSLARRTRRGDRGQPVKIRSRVRRVGQNLFREGLLELWEGRCAVTGLAVPALLRASHIKPWADCETDAERLDVYDGILLAPHLDAAFDRGLITVVDDGAIAVSEELDDDARATLGLDHPLHVRRLTDGHRVYLPWHRERVFKSHAAEGRDA